MAAEVRRARFLDWTIGRRPAFQWDVHTHAHDTLTNEVAESGSRGSGDVPSSAPVTRDKKPCAKVSSFPRRLPKMAEGQVGLCAGHRGEGPGGFEAGAGLAPFSLPTCVVGLHLDS